MPQVNWLAIIVSAIAMFGLGALWYSPMLFARQWAKAAGINMEAMPRQGIPLVMVGAFVLTLLMAANLAFFIQGQGLPLWGAVGAAVAAGLGWATFSVWILSLFEQRPFA